MFFRLKYNINKKAFTYLACLCLFSFFVGRTKHISLSVVSSISSKSKSLDTSFKGPIKNLNYKIYWLI